MRRKRRILGFDDLRPACCDARSRPVCSGCSPSGEQPSSCARRSSCPGAVANVKNKQAYLPLTCHRAVPGIFEPLWISSCSPISLLSSTMTGGRYSELSARCSPCCTAPGRALAAAQAFVVIDATVNTQIDNAKTLAPYAGIRFANLSAGGRSEYRFDSLGKTASSSIIDGDWNRQLILPGTNEVSQD